MKIYYAVREWLLDFFWWLGVLSGEKARATEHLLQQDRVPLEGSEKDSRLTTANVILLTATPGSGKTLRAVQMMDECMQAGDLVYVCNVKGIRLPGVMDWPDATDWRNIPKGGVLFVDEAQRQGFKKSRNLPEYIEELSILRHYGIRIVFITQQPGYLHEHLLGLVGRHEHLLRKNGGKTINIFRSDELMENTKSLRSRITADTEAWTLPSQYYPYYDSAEIHTHKFQLPSRWKKGFLFVGIALVLFGVFGFKLYDSAVNPDFGISKGTNEPGDPASESEPGLAGLGSAPGVRKVPLTDAEYFAQFKPRRDDLPGSAPAYDHRQVVARPKVYCLDASPHGRCRCATEQGTVYLLPHKQCAYLARWGGAYDPFLAPANDRSSLGQKPDTALAVTLPEPEPVHVGPSIPLDAPRVPGVLNPSMTPLTVP